MYMQHRHMVWSKSHICHDLVLDQNANDNAYSTTFLREALDVDHKMAILVIGLYYNTFSHIFVQHHHYNDHDILCLSILFFWFFFHILPDQLIHVSDAP